jgi:hypothetical protein
MKLRMVVAAAVLVSGAVHLILWADGVRDVSVIGPMFLLNAVAALGIAAAVMFWRNWLPLLMAAGFGAATLGAFLISATVGLFGVHESWTGGYVITANLAELVALAASSWALYAEGWAAMARDRLPHRHTGSAGRTGRHAT